MRCTRGAILDIIVDLRPESPTYLEHVAVELSADNYRALYVPERFAHGYQALEDTTETSYQVGEFYAPGVEGGLAPDDPGLGLSWPLPVTEISEKDAAWASAVGSRGRAQAPDGRLPRARDRREGSAVIIVDTALRRREEEGRPIQVGMIGAGFMAQGLANQIVNSVPGMRLAAVYGRKLERALGVCDYAGLTDTVVATTQAEVEDAIRAGRPVATEDAFLLCQAEQIDVLVDVTGSVEFGAQVVLEALQPRQARAPDERRARRDDRADPPGPRQPRRRHRVGRRRRRAGPADEPRALGAGTRAHPARDRQRQGTPGPLPQPRDPAGASRRSGTRTRRW